MGLETGCEFESSFCVGDFVGLGRLERVVGEGVVMMGWSSGAEGRVGVTGISIKGSRGRWRVLLERSSSSGSLRGERSASAWRGAAARK